MCGTESWSEFIPTVILLRFHELLDRYIDAGFIHALLKDIGDACLGMRLTRCAGCLQARSWPVLRRFSVLAFVRQALALPETWWALQKRGHVRASAPRGEVLSNPGRTGRPGKISHRVGTALAKLRGGQPRAARIAYE
jgi:hypothetical protein